MSHDNLPPYPSLSCLLPARRHHTQTSSHSSVTSTCTPCLHFCFLLLIRVLRMLLEFVEAKDVPIVPPELLGATDIVDSVSKTRRDQDSLVNRSHDHCSQCIFKLFNALPPLISHPSSQNLPPSCAEKMNCSGHWWI